MAHMASGSASPYLTSDKLSFAYVSASKRWPVIVTGAIDDVHRSISACNDEEKIKEGKTIVENIGKLKYEIQHDRNLTPLDDDGQGDIARYNEDLEALGLTTWMSIPWLFAECYLYRRLHTFFARSRNWKNYDIFSRQKLSTFKSSRPAILELAARYRTLITHLEGNATSTKSPQELEEAEKILFMEMCEICLWGNATDLSLLTSLTYEDIQKLQGADARKKAEENILVNDLPMAYKTLKEARDSGKKERQIDIVLDNAGFELFVDLILAGYLLAAGLATQVIIHPKSIPWFVSDVMPADLAALLHALADPQGFFTASADEHTETSHAPLSETEASDLLFLFQNWSGLHGNGQIILRPNQFWTSGHSYWDLPKQEPRLHQDLKDSELVIFKGDLNYRKLTADGMWDTTTPFTTAIGPLGPHSGMRTLALRTCKADTVVGLPPGEDDRLKATADGGGHNGPRKWAWSGKYAVVQFCDGKA